MQLIVIFVIALGIFAWYTEDLIKSFINPVAVKQQVAQQASAKSARKVPQFVTDEELVELAKTDPQAAVRLYQLSLQSIQLYQSVQEAKMVASAKTSASEVESAKYNPDDVQQSLKNAVAKLNATPEETVAAAAQSDPSKRVLVEANFREKVKNSDLQTAFQEYQESYHEVQKEELKKLQDFLATGKYE